MRQYTRLPSSSASSLPASTAFNTRSNITPKDATMDVLLLHCNVGYRHTDISSEINRRSANLENKALEYVNYFFSFRMSNDESIPKVWARRSGGASNRCGAGTRQRDCA